MAISSTCSFWAKSDGDCEFNVMNKLGWAFAWLSNNFWKNSTSCKTCGGAAATMFQRFGMETIMDEGSFAI